MRRHRPASVLVPALVVFLHGAALFGQAPLRAGAEFQVNTYTTNGQAAAAVARDHTGAFVVVWSSSGQDGSNSGVFGRRFDASGQRMAAEFRVNSYTSGYQTLPAVARAENGTFVVVWQSNGQDADSYGVFGRRFSAAGVALANEFQVTIRTTGFQYRPRVELDAEGDFVVVWSSVGQDGHESGVFARRFSSSGAAFGGELAVNVHTQNAQGQPAVAVESDGDFVVAWESFGQDGDDYGVFARRFDSTGVATIEFQVTTFTAYDQKNPALAIDADGDMVVVWNSNANGISGRRFDLLGNPRAAEFRIDEGEFGVGFPAVDMDPAGGFAVTWQTYAKDGDYMGIFARHFDAQGTARGGELQVNTRTVDYQVSPDVAMDAGGDFVVVWDSDSQDGSSTGVFAQRYLTIAVLDIDANGSVTPLTDALMVLRYVFGFRGSTLTGGAIGAGCTRCDAAAIEPYLAGLV